MGVGDAKQDSKLLDNAMNDMSIIAAQKPAITKAKKSISNFKLRAGMPIGCTVTLRRQRMYDFLDKFISIAVPRIRDFRGFADSSFDGRGNYTIGLTEQLVWPEIDYDAIDKVRGMGITIVTSAKTDEEARRLLALLGVPFKRSA